MKSFFRKSSIIFFVLYLGLLFTSCLEKTEERKIQEFVANMGKLAQKKDISQLMLYFADDYSDFEGRDTSGTRDMLNNYFMEYKGIVIHILSTRVDEIGPPQARIQTEVALSSGSAEVFRRLVKFSTDNYRIAIRLTKTNGSWLIQYAEWKYVSITELYPESLAILKKIFPNI